MKTEKFGKLTAAQKRVAIAKDVLKQIKARKLIIRTGNFVDVPIDYYFEEHNKQYLNSSSAQPCTVCAIGAAIVCGIRLFNEVSFKGDVTPEESWPLIRHFFSANQAVLIEAAFECGGHYSHSYGPWPSDVDVSAARQFGEKYDSDEDRAIAIFQNIVANNGVFKP
jgi:hypothetical protein